MVRAQSPPQQQKGEIMKKTVTVYKVSTPEAAATYPTQAQANKAVGILNRFNVTAEVEKVKIDVDIPA